MTTGNTRTVSDEMRSAVGELGFAEAFRQHITAIALAHIGTEIGTRLKDLHEWMSADPALARILPALEIAGPNQPAGGANVVAEAEPESAAPTPSPPDGRLPDIRESNGSAMWLRWQEPFANWSGTVRNTPALTAVPRTVGGVQALTRWAIQSGRTVRGAGYRHSWTELFSADNQVLVSMLPPPTVVDLPAVDPPIDPADQLQGISIVGTVVEGGVTKALCRIGAATTNDQFRMWCLSEAGGDWEWTLPVNTIIVEITFGGSNATICHGAGSAHRTLNDLVVAIEFVNARGEVQLVDDPTQLAAAAGCFGLLGIVTAVTFKLEPMTYAVMQPVRARLPLSIPPPPGFAIPAGVDMTGIDQSALDAAWDAFVQACENDYYAEWFWFPYQRDCWINTWNNDGTRSDATVYPDELETIAQEIGEYLGELVTSSVFRSDLVAGKWQAILLGAAAMASLPTGRTIVTPVIEAIHFRRGVHNMPVLDMELEIPIPGRADNPSLPDWTVCRDAWWAAVGATYADDDAPFRITLEMRITADSAITMAPQYGNSHGTCSIEVITTDSVDPQAWARFLQTVIDSWCALRDSSGQPLNVRPHWAKQWQGLLFDGRPAIEYLRAVAYRDRLPEFRDGLAAVARAGGYSPSELAVFSNPLLRELFGAIPD
jgi:hypothetical protein